MSGEPCKKCQVNHIKKCQVNHVTLPPTYEIDLYCPLCIIFTKSNDDCQGCLLKHLKSLQTYEIILFPTGSLAYYSDYESDESSLC